MLLMTLTIMMLEVVRMNASFGDRSFAAAAPRVWNSLPDAVRNSVGMWTGTGVRTSVEF